MQKLAAVSFLFKRKCFSFVWKTIGLQDFLFRTFVVVVILRQILVKRPLEQKSLYNKCSVHEFMRPPNGIIKQAAKLKQL